MCTSRHSLSSWRQAHADLNPAASDPVSRCRAPDKCTGPGQLCSGTAWTWTQPGALKADRPSPLRVSAAEWTPSRGRGSVPIPPRVSRRGDIKMGRARARLIAPESATGSTRGMPVGAERHAPPAGGLGPRQAHQEAASLGELRSVKILSHWQRSSIGGKDTFSQRS